MLVPWGRVFIRGAGLKPLLLCKLMTVSGGQFLPVRALATTATKKVASSKSKTAVTRSKAPAKKKPATTRTKQGATRRVAAKFATTRAGVKKATKKVAANKIAAKKIAAKKVAAKRGTVSGVKTKTRTTRKTLSEEEKKQAKMKAKVKSLLEQALKPPPSSTASPWVAFLTEKLKGSNTNASKFLKEGMGKLKEEYSSLTPGQVEALKAKATALKENKNKALANWVQKHSVSDIHQANLARSAIRRLKAQINPAPIGLRGSFRAIPDDRYPLRPRSAHIFYVKEKMDTLPSNEKGKALGALVKKYFELPQAEAQKYIDMAADDAKRFRKQLKAAGIEPPPSTSA